MVLAVRGSNPFNHLMFHITQNIFFSKNVIPINSKQSSVFIPHQILISGVSLTNFTTSLFNARMREFSIKVILIQSNDLIKPLVTEDISWSSGMISHFLFLDKDVYKKKTLTVKNARRDWSLWKYMISIWFTHITYSMIKVTPLSIRTRRLVKLMPSNMAYLTIRYNWTQYNTPKRSIKRWLKKKYSTQSWR